MKNVINLHFCLSVLPSFVCPICLLQQCAAALLLWAWRVGDIDRLLFGTTAQHAAANAGSATFSAYVGS